MKFSVKTILAALVAVMTVSSCGLFKKNVEESADYNNGRQAGSVLVNLAKDYAASGSLNLSNPQNILGVSNLAQLLSTLRSDSNLAHKDFDKGLMESCPKVTKSNLEKVHDALEELSQMDLDGIVNRLQKNKTDGKTDSMKGQLEDVLAILK